MFFKEVIKFNFTCTNLTPYKIGLFLLSSVFGFALGLPVIFLVTTIIFSFIFIVITEDYRVPLFISIMILPFRLPFVLFGEVLWSYQLLVIFIIIAFFGFLLNIINGKIKEIHLPLVWFFLGFLLIMLASLFKAFDFRKSLYVVKAFMFHMVFMYLLVNTKGEELHKVIRVTVSISIFLLLLGIGQYLFKFYPDLPEAIQQYKYRAISVLGHPNQFGLYSCVIFLIVCLYPFIHERYLNLKVIRIPLLKTTIPLLCLAGLYMSLSRSSWIVFFVGVVSLLFVFKKKKVLVVISIVLIISIFIPGRFSDRVKSIINYKERGNAERIEQVKVAIKMVKDYPVLGVGLENYDDNYKKYEDKKLDSRVLRIHNNIMLIGSELGISGLLVYILLLYKIFSVLYKEFKNNMDSPVLIRYYACWLVLLVMIFIHAQLNGAFFQETYTWFILGMGLRKVL